jgi:hypothetical protein
MIALVAHFARVPAFHHVYRHWISRSVAPASLQVRHRALGSLAAHGKVSFDLDQTKHGKRQAHWLIYGVAAEAKIVRCANLQPAR